MVVAESWDADALGTAGDCIHRLPPGHGEVYQDNKETTFLNRYKPYTSLDEWEPIKDRLNKESVPVQRSCLQDYLVNPEAESMTNIYEHAAEVGLEPAPVAAPRKNTEDDKSVSPARVRIRQGTPKAAATRGGVSLSPRGARSPRKAALEGVGRMCLGLSSPRGEASEDAKPDAGESAANTSLLVNVVAVNDYGIAMGDRRRVPDSRKVTDRDTVLYPTPISQKSSRVTNSSSRRRLNDLLTSPSEALNKQTKADVEREKSRIEMAGVHPSRYFRLVPSQNLRVV
eukprot:gnl/TRDRNA2_/TRDRNA2_191757_c0_seq1.p1 gnl/TRDRNA2_/TRDRNA2_191757_c0~~gnl/TRDRNA2_/TRDRNA2_191757_c0_seq1.p1  ORF type:complete len:285 (+),score=39.66 gnl/TRDRNA2_/TRDRNA2_191757_c0_seq1:67-921(+)